MPQLLDFYELLGLTPDATADEIRHAYHEAALRYHPDTAQDQDLSDKFLHVQEAYEVLINPSKRAEYDTKRALEREDPVLVNVLYSRAAVSILEEPQLIYILLEFSPKVSPQTLESPPLNLCLVLDRSTSMQGERLDTVKLATIEIIRQLRPQDIISIVTFSDKATVLLPAEKRPERKTIENQIHLIQSEGGTEIFHGLEAGYREVSRFANRSFINHMILLTDGRTYGDEDDCLNLAKDIAVQGIRITGLGVGTEWNDHFLDELVSPTGGVSVYLSQASDIKTFMQEKFYSLNQIFAEQVTLEMRLDEGVQLNTAYRLSPESTLLLQNLRLPLGSIPMTGRLSVLLEFVLPPIPTGTTRLKIATAELSFTVPSRKGALYHIPIHLSRLTSETIDTSSPPQLIVQALSHIMLYRMQEKARKEVSQGKIQEASTRLQRLATQLLNMGEPELANTAFMEAERIQKTRMLSAEGEKKIKYGTRSLLLPASISQDTEL